MTIRACTYETPVGPLTVLADDDEVVVAAGFCATDDLVERLPEHDRSDVEPIDRLGTTHQPILDYLDGDLTALGRIPVRQSGTELQQTVWNRLGDIPPGQTRTYAELADESGNPRAVRAVGTACGRNLIAPFVPCHRVLRSDGSLGGYVYGLDVKRWLLEHESAG